MYRLQPLFAFKYPSHPSCSSLTTYSTMSISQHPAPMCPEDVPQDDLERDLETLMYEDADSSHEPARAHESQEPSPPPKRLRGAQLSLDIAVSPTNLTSLVLCLSVNHIPELHTHCWSIIMCFLVPGSVPSRICRTRINVMPKCHILPKFQQRRKRPGMSLTL